MPPKHQISGGLQRRGAEWVNWRLSFNNQLPADWSAKEAAQNPDPWLSDNATLHALRRLAIQADQPACALLLSLRGQDIDKQRHLEAVMGESAAAAKACEAVQAARDSLRLAQREAPALLTQCAAGDCLPAHVQPPTHCP